MNRRVLLGLLPVALAALVGFIALRSLTAPDAGGALAAAGSDSATAPLQPNPDATSATLNAPRAVEQPPTTWQITAVAASPDDIVDGDAPAPAPPAFSDPGAPTEAGRRAAYVDRNRRRNALRAQVLAGEYGVEAGRIEAVFNHALDERIRLYGTLDPARPDMGALHGGLRRIGADLERDLRAALSETAYAGYLRMEEEGLFVLPDEVKDPTR